MVWGKCVRWSLLSSIWEEMLEILLARRDLFCSASIISSWLGWDRPPGKSPRPLLSFRFNKWITFLCICCYSSFHLFSFEVRLLYAILLCVWEDQPTPSSASFSQFQLPFRWNFPMISFWDVLCFVNYLLIIVLNWLIALTMDHTGAFLSLRGYMCSDDTDGLASCSYHKSAILFSITSEASPFSSLLIYLESHYIISLDDCIPPSSRRLRANGILQVG